MRPWSEAGLTGGEDLFKQGGEKAQQAKGDKKEAQKKHVPWKRQ